MHVVGVVAAVVLGIAFVVAGASKLALGAAWPTQARDLGAPAWTAPLVPWLELAVGAALVVQVARPVPAVGAGVLLVVFTVMIVRLLARGQHPACACFGAWSAKPIGVGHVIRNVCLLTLAVVAIAAS